MAARRRYGGFRKISPFRDYPRNYKGTSYKLRLLRVKLLSFASSSSIIVAILLVIFLFMLFLWYSRDLPSPEKIKRKEGFSTIILDRNEKPIYDIYEDKNRIPVNLSDIPDHLKKATVAIEDKDFYKHQGFDTKGIIRAIFHIITFRGIEGGSTLTQQLVKNVLLTSDRTLPRKIKEFMLAVQIERKYSKDEILQMYLNEAPYGGTMWGIESAAKGYFGKHAKDLTLLESVVLASLPQRPSYYSPFGGNPTAYQERAAEVLRRMREDGFISNSSELELKRDLVNVKFASAETAASPHFVEYVKKQLVERFGDTLVEGGGLKVITTLDMDVQQKTEAIIKEELDKIKSLNVSNGAALVINPSTGEIMAYVGSRDYSSTEEDFQGKFDVVSLGLRQPGSALKPITYAVALSKGYTAASLLMDVETKFLGGEGKPDYVPKNYDNKFRGPVQIRFALGNSINLPAVKMTALVGISDILKTAYAMGINSLAPTDENIKRLGLSITLGGGEVTLHDLTSSFGVFTTGGILNDPYAIAKVVDNSGKTLYEHKKTSGKKVLGEDVAFIISHILSDNNARKEVFGTNSYLVIPGRTVVVKTGTTDDKRDNWSVGGTASAVAGVWVGNNDNSPMSPKLASGATGAAPIWNRIIKLALSGKSDESLKKPDNVEAIEVDAFAGGLPHDGRPTRSEYFIKGTEPTSVAPIYKKIKLSKADNNKLANGIEVLTGAYDEKEFIVFTEADPTSGGSKNQWQEGIDAWLQTQSDTNYYKSKDTSTTDENKVAVSIKKPSDGSNFDSNNIEIEASATALENIKKMELYIDDNLKTTINGNNLKETVSLDPGEHRIKVKAFDEKDISGESTIKVGVKTNEISLTPTSVPSPTP